MEGSSTPTPTPEPVDPDRCLSCGALVSADAEWCGQCFTPLKKSAVSREELAAKVGIRINQEAPSPLAQGEEGPVTAPAAKVRLTWPCPACEFDNDIELSFCERCATPFAALMRSDEEPVHVEPIEALKWSLIYPGLGHRKAGRGAEGAARAAIFTLSLVFLLMVAFSGSGSGSIAQTLMVGLYLIATLVAYMGSATEAYRIARGGAPFVGSRTLLWVTVALLLASIGLLALTATTVVRR